ncbi:hypothetical protein KI688_012850 [Linnemannia hyalina]|uniref:Uncharacterized protein n=1 Tax=Linnemannia hyalina TaxID=64524 RepID=A0A9P8BT84_9FUNG|nr:hypothetical protein KI688_012850 [Linnemannia hyalina]
MAQQQQQQQQEDENGFPYIHPNESNRSLHRLNTAANNNQDDDRRAAANMVSAVSVQQQQHPQQQQQPQTSPQQQRNRPPVDRPQTSPSLRPASPFLELSTLPVAYQQQGFSRRNPDLLNNNTAHASPSFSPMMRPQEPTALPSGSRNNCDGDNVQRAATSYHTKNSPLPRPLHLRRPIVTDMSITPSSKVVATIGRGVPVVVQNDDTNSPIEPPVVIIGKSPVLMALGLGTSMLAHSQSSASAASPKATPPAKSTARRESTRRQAGTTQTPQSQASTEAQTQIQQQKTPHHQGAIQFPVPISEEQDMVDESDENPFMSKEEFCRPAPQAILPEGFKHAQFTLPLLPPPPQSKKAVNDDSSDDEVTGLDTGQLVLEPYLTPAELAAHIPFPVPAVAPKYTRDPAAPSDGQTVAQNITPPTRPLRRATDAADQLYQSQSKFQEQERQALPSIHPLTPSANAPWSPSHPPIHRSSSPLPSPTPSSLSNKSSSTNSTRVKPPPPTLPPPRRSRSNSLSQAGSERSMSPAPSLSYTSSNISTGPSIISSQPETIVTDVSSFVSLGDTPTTTASMFCTSPTFLPVLSPTSPATPGRTFSVSTVGSPATPRLPPGQSPLIEEGDVYSWMEGKFDNDSNDDGDNKVVVHQVKKIRVPEAVGGGTRLSRFNFDI